MMNLFLTTIITLIAWSGFPFLLLAQTIISPSPLPGWTHDEDDGVLLSGGAVTLSSPVIAEIDGDTSNGKEVAAGGADGVLYVYKSDGTELWSASLPITRCTGSSTNKLLSSPVVGDLFGNGIPHVVVGYGGIGKPCDGGVAAFRGSDGTRIWNFSLKRYSKREKFFSFSYSVFSSPALADTDGDGKMEVGFGSFDRNVYLLNADGSVRWYYTAADTVWSSPGFANVDDDSELEMIIGTDISRNRVINPPTNNGGYVYAFKTTSRKTKKINFRDPTSFVWKATFDQVIFSSPVVADVMPDSPGNEVIIGSGCYFPEGTKNKKGRWFKILRISDGKVLQTLTTTACSSSSVAVGDIDDDGILEIVATVNGDKSVGGDGESHLMAWKASSNTPLWSITPRGRGNNYSFGGNFQSPTIADINGDGSLEVVISNYSHVGIYRGSDGTALTCQDNSCSESSLVLNAKKVLQSTPAIGDINGDGVLDIVAAGAFGGSGALYAWTNLSEVLTNNPGAQAGYSAPWPMFRGNAEHTGLLGD